MGLELDDLSSLSTIIWAHDWLLPQTAVHVTRYVVVATFRPQMAIPCLFATWATLRQKLKFGWMDGCARPYNFQLGCHGGMKKKRRSEFDPANPLIDGPVMWILQERTTADRRRLKLEIEKLKEWERIESASGPLRKQK